MADPSTSRTDCITPESEAVPITQPQQTPHRDFNNTRMRNRFQNGFPYEFTGADLTFDVFIRIKEYIHNNLFEETLVEALIEDFGNFEVAALDLAAN